MAFFAALLRVVHIAAGVGALLLFLVPLVTKKGGRAHRRVGRLYVRAMYVVAGTAMIAAPIRISERAPSGWHFPIFLMYIALLSFTAAFYGERVLRNKTRSAPSESVLDLVWPVLLLVASAALVGYGIAVHFALAIYFAPVGVLVGWPQLRMLRSTPQGKTWWLGEHLQAMIVSCIATVTAFLVFNASRFFQAGGSPAVWLAPTILGVPLIVYFRRKYAPKPAREPG